MTEPYDRRLFLELAEQEFERSLRYQHPLSILMLDVDDVKAVNDDHGQPAGDLLMQAVADVCCQGLRRIDLVGRYGDDEFVALLPETPVAMATAAVERLQMRVAQITLRFDDQALLVSISIGVAGRDESCLRLETLLSHADQALNDAKRAGKNRMAVWQG